MNIEIQIFETNRRGCPFETWSAKLSRNIRNAITTRISRLRVGNFGDTKMLKGAKGLYELRLHLGPGYRIYYGKQGDTLIILLAGGTKSTQKADIKKAIRYWGEYRDGQNTKL